AKLAAQPLPNLKINTNVTIYRGDGSVYSHRDANGRSYDFNLDGLPVLKKRAYLLGLTSHYNVTENMIWTVTANRFRTYTKVAPEHLTDTYWNDWPGYSEDASGAYDGTIHEDNYLGYRDFSDPYQVVGFTVGDDFDPTYNRREAIYNSFGMALLGQVTKSHQLKGGFQVRRYDVDWDFKQFYNRNPYGERYQTAPLLASAYFQDKMEYQDFIINAGLRFDYRDAEIEYNSTPGALESEYKTSEAKTELSPRLGVSFPISEHSVMHFNYGVYYQEPRYEYLYTNLQGNVSSGYPLLGNPDLSPEKTTSYELGLNHLIGDDLRVDVTAYYKDVEDLVTTRSAMEVAGNAVTQFVNGDYGSVKGFDFMLERLPVSGYVTASISYGYMIATGNGSDAKEPYYTFLTSAEDTLAPVSEFPLDFDQRHTVTGVVTLRLPREWRGDLFGLTIPGAWGASVVGHYGSGLPYTPTDASGNRLGERNEGRLPASYAFDFRVNKDFFVGAGDQKLGVFIEVDNIFDRRNVINVYSRTGQPDNDGLRTGAGLALDQNTLDRLDDLYDQDPLNYSPPRTVRAGFEFNF
ncbi:TonB-dependent receptor, partial [candidate division GN15 bacterium]|nr:TonB-dependent receptor [candidate division GN15 bacterium]